MNIEFWKTYAGCWSVSEDVRRKLLPQVASADVCYRDPNTEVAGHAAFSAYMGGFQKGFPGHRFDIDHVDAHHGRSLARWRLVDAGGKLVQHGVSAAVHDGEGRLRDVTGFFPV